MTQPTTPLPPTEKQANFLASLCRERGIDYAGLQAQAIALGTWTRRDVSTAIDDIRTWPKTPQAPVPLGVHVVPGTPGDGEAILVQVKRSQSSGNHYGKVRKASGRSWTYRPGALDGLSEATLLDETTAAKLGLQFGICQVCARDLTDPESVRLGIGPVCRKRVANRWANVATGQPVPPPVLPSPSPAVAIDPVTRAASPIWETTTQAVTRASSPIAPQEAPSSTQAPSGPSDTGNTPSAAPGGSQGGPVSQESGGCPWNSEHTLLLEGQAHGWDGPTCGRCGGAVILDRATMAYYPDRNRMPDQAVVTPEQEDRLLDAVEANRQEVTLESLAEEAHRRAVDTTTGKRKLRQAKLKGGLR